MVFREEQQEEQEKRKIRWLKWNHTARFPKNVLKDNEKFWFCIMGITWYLTLPLYSTKAKQWWWSTVVTTESLSSCPQMLIQLLLHLVFLNKFTILVWVYDLRPRNREICEFCIIGECDVYVECLKWFLAKTGNYAPFSLPLSKTSVSPQSICATLLNEVHEVLSCALSLFRQSNWLATHMW